MVRNAFMFLFMAGAVAFAGIVYGEAGGEKLTMDYYPPAGPAPHPVAIVIHGGGFVRGTSKNNSEAYCADFLAPAICRVLDQLPAGAEIPLSGDGGRCGTGDPLRPV